jgi:hypothetical protein
VVGDEGSDVEGEEVGLVVTGALVGLLELGLEVVGFEVGPLEGTLVGASEGHKEGFAVGWKLGGTVGLWVGYVLGASEGLRDGLRVGKITLSQHILHKEIGERQLSAEMQQNISVFASNTLK